MRRLLALLLLATPMAHADGGSAVTLKIQGVQSTEGQMLVVLFASEEGFPGDSTKAIRRTIAEPVAPVTTVRFEGLQPGTYAGVAVHDLNNNGEVDVRRVIPIPTEPLGTTRDAKAMFGPPKFKAASFELGAGTAVEAFTLATIGG